MLFLVFHPELILVILSYFTQGYFQLFFWLFKVMFGYFLLFHPNVLLTIPNYLKLFDVRLLLYF
jgi:hypothetical protein